MNTQQPELQKVVDEATQLLKTLSHPARLMICCQLQDGELSVSEIESKLNIKQPNLSRELAKLREDGLVETRRESKVIFYRLAESQRVEKMLQAICAVMLDKPINFQNDTAPLAKSSPKFRPNRPGGYGVFARTTQMET